MEGLAVVVGLAVLASGLGLVGFSVGGKTMADLVGFPVVGFPVTGFAVIGLAVVGPLVVGDSVVGLSVEVGALVAGMVDGVGVGASVPVGLNVTGASLVVGISDC